MENMMKKLISTLLTVLLLTSFGSAAFAEGYSETYDEMGMTLSYTEEFEDTLGIWFPNPAGCVDDGIYYMSFDYLAMSMEEYYALLEKGTDNWTQEELTKFSSSVGVLTNLLAIDGGRGEADLLEAFGMEASENVKMTEVGRTDDIVFYSLDLLENMDVFLDGIEPEYKDEFSTLREALLEVLKNGKYFTPVVPGEELIGQVMSFETTDLDGNPVSSEDVFAEHEITMVNVWATWCGPCTGELRELGEMHRRYAEKNVALVGICQDADESLDTCKELLDENGVDYLNVMPFDGMLETLKIEGFPTSFFVNSSGEILALPFTGAPADMSSYEEIIDSLLEGEVSGGTGTAPVQANSENVYRVIVSDSEGNPVQGVMLQLCSDTSCMMASTDADGIAAYEAEEGIYTVHVLKAPEGYEKTDEEFRTLDTYCDVTVILQKTA